MAVAPSDLGPLLGRDAEIELLTSLLDGIENGGGAVVLRGEPGIGKSRLLSEAEALAEERQMSVLAARGVQSEARLAFGGLQQLLRPVRSRATGLPAAHQAVLEAALGVGGDEPLELFRIALAVLDLLSDAATDSPLLLVGHSYGGAVISVAGASTPNAVGLVYVAAFALDEGESFAEIFAEFGDTPLVGAVRPSTYPLADGGTAVELTIAPELYREAFAADLSEDAIRVLAVSQRPFAAIFEDRAEAAAWKTLPSWYVVATADNAIPPEAERHMAQRAGAQTIEVDASHSIALSQPKAVADLIQTAITATAPVPAGAS